jgi:hypothetical protein
LSGQVSRVFSFFCFFFISLCDWYTCSLGCISSLNNFLNN